ncbi:hypothetical protein IJ096_02915 [Candidatus Saccharibacteria bacterium]|nr:hypothetical protein [Candidatus Saccharibacteria bacterium]
MYVLLGDVDGRAEAKAISFISEKYKDASNDTALIFLPKMVEKLTQVACAEIDGGHVYNSHTALYYFLVDFYSDFGHIDFKDLYGECIYRFSPGEGYKKFANKQEYEMRD